MPTIESSLVRLIPLFPLLGVVVCAAASRLDARRLAVIVAPGMVGLSFVVAIVSVARLLAAPAGAAIVDSVYSWIHSGPFTVDVSLRIDALSAVMVLVVTGVGFLI